MSKKDEEILEEVYSGTLAGEIMRKKKLVKHDYLYKYGKLIKEGVLKPTPVFEKLARDYNFSRQGVMRMLKDAGIYGGCNNPIIYPVQITTD